MRGRGILVRKKIDPAVDFTWLGWASSHRLWGKKKPENFPKGSEGGKKEKKGKNHHPGSAPCARKENGIPNVRYTKENPMRLRA